MHEPMKSAQDAWANPSTCVSCDLDFWYTGTELQKAQEGLLSSILMIYSDSGHSLSNKLFPNDGPCRKTITSSRISETKKSCL